MRSYFFVMVMMMVLIGFVVPVSAASVSGQMRVSVIVLDEHGNVPSGLKNLPDPLAIQAARILESRGFDAPANLHRQDGVVIGTARLNGEQKSVTVDVGTQEIWVN